MTTPRNPTPCFSGCSASVMVSVIDNAFSSAPEPPRADGDRRYVILIASPGCFSWMRFPRSSEF